MRTLILAASALTLLAAPAFAQSTASNSVTLSSTVAPACGVGNHIGGPGTAAGWTQYSGPIDIGSLADGNGQFLTAINLTNVSFGNLWCNAAADVSISVQPLSTTNSTTDTGSFRNSFDVSVQTDAAHYTGRAEDFVITAQGGAAPEVISGTIGRAFETGTGRYGGLDSITVLPEGRGAAGGYYRPVAGAYTSVITITATTS
ncbi:MAG: hypothetical protein J0L52_01900 [Caulobacterales bacterium]|nr:hypothetical protein [Caulobacterales bacterium]